MKRGGLAVILWSAVAAASAQSGPAPLPEPLSLRHALSLSGEAHPDLVVREAMLSLSRADLDAVESTSDVSATLRARARYVEPNSSAIDRGHDDHAVMLVVEKVLYDFGRSEAAREAAGSLVRGEEWLLLDERGHRRLAILQAYFNVLLADLRFARENEAMAIAFIRSDRTRDRADLGQASDIELLEAQSDYQTVRQARFEAAAAQRSTRARLAEVLNRPGELSSTLQMPVLAVLDRERPPLEELEREALDGNPRLRAHRERIEGARSAIEAARAGARPILRSAIETAAHSRRTSTRDTLRAGLELEVPITSGGRLDARVARREAELTLELAELRREDRSVRQQLLEAWLDLGTLGMRREAAAAFADYRDLYLDRSRALYEQEIRTDLGDAMVQVSQARHRAAEVDFAIAMTWARIHALLGRTTEEFEEWMFGSP